MSAIKRLAPLSAVANAAALASPELDEYLSLAVKITITFGAVAALLVVACFLRPWMTVVAAAIGFGVLIAGVCLLTPFSGSGNEAEMAVFLVVGAAWMISAAVLLTASFAALIVGIIRWVLAREKRAGQKPLGR